MNTATNTNEFAHLGINTNEPYQFAQIKPWEMKQETFQPKPIQRHAHRVVKNPNYQQGSYEMIEREGN